MLYIAAPWARKAEALKVRQQIRDAGISVGSSWMDDPDLPYEQASSQEDAERDIDELQHSDALLFLNLEMSEGKATELGMALMLGIPIFCIGGKARNVFLHLPSITHIGSVEEFLSALQSL